MPSDKVRKSLNYSVLDGAFYSAKVGFGESFFGAFGVFLNASSTQLGLLESLPRTLGALSQLYAGRLLAKVGSRKMLVCAAVFFEALFHIPIALAFFLGELKVYWLIAFISAYWILGSIVNPAWTSWIGDLTEDVNRGRYFGRRNKISGVVSLATLFIAGYILQSFQGGGQYIGFFIVLALALISRILSFYYLLKKHEPEYLPPAKEPFSLLEFLRQAKHTNFGTLTLYIASMNFAVFFAAPFFAAYLLTDIGVDYWTFTLLLGVGLLVKLSSMPVWGKAADRWGSRSVLVVAGLTMPVVPLLLMLSKDLPGLIIAQAVSGFTWAGFELATLNYTFDSTSPEKRTTCVAYYNAINGVAVLAGAMAAAIVIGFDLNFSSKYYFVFFLSFILRYAVSFIFLPKLRETKRVESIGYTELLLKVITKLPAVDSLYNLAFFPKKKLDRTFRHSIRLTRDGIRKFRK